MAVLGRYPNCKCDDICFRIGCNYEELWVPGVSSMQCVKMQTARLALRLYACMSTQVWWLVLDQQSRSAPTT